MATNPVGESSTEDATRLRDSLNDLVAMAEQSALWADGQPPHTVSGALDALIVGTNELIAVNTRLTNELAQQRHKEESPRGNELNFQLTVDSIPGMVHTMTATGGVEFVNRQILEFFGKTLDELNNWADVVHPDDRARVVDQWTRSVATGEPFDSENRVLSADGTYRWLHSRGLPLRDVHGNIVRWYNLLTDIDERKRAEDALRESERESRLIVDTIPGLVATLTPAGEVDRVNHQLVVYCGQPLEAMKEWGTNGTVHADDLPDVVRVFTRAITSGEPYDFEARIRRFDGVYRWFQVRGLPLRDSNGRLVRWNVLLSDIDERKKAEDALTRSEAFLVEGQQLARVGNFSWRVAANEITWSEQLYHIYELEVGLPVTLELIRTRVHPEDLTLLEKMIEQARNGRNDFEWQYRLLMPDQSVKYLHAVVHPTRDQQGQLEYIAAVQDVTSRKRSEEALDRARSELAHVARVMSLGALTASIAHEVSQPLSGIITNGGTCLRMLDADPPNLDGARETARRTIRDAHRASDVITWLRALFSKKEYTFEPLDLNEATREVITLSLSDLQRNRVMLQADLAQNLPVVTGDRIQLQQVILNLLRNASDAMIDVHDRPRRLLIKTEREEGDRVRVTVRDAGMGIAADSRDSLFDAFYTTKSGGMGIGLFVSRSIVERHHGRIWAQTNDGPGATFSFSIPLLTPDSTNTAQASPT